MSPLRLRKLLIVYLLLLVPIGWLATKYQPYLLDGDAVSYMDIADLLHAHRWAGAVNGYWHPLYPAVLAAAQAVFHPSRWTEIPAYYLANYGIFPARARCDGGVRLCARSPAQPHTQRWRTTAALARGARAAGLRLIVIATYAKAQMLATGLVRPDALLQALMLLAFAMMLNALATESLIYAPLMGLFFGLAYLTKSFAFLIALLSIGVVFVFQLWMQRRALTRVLANAALALVIFGLIAGPYVAALSHQKHRFDFGDSGALNYAWYVGGVEKMHLEPAMTSSFGPATVHLIHPERQLLASPGIYSYRAEPYGTYPDWFDTTYFNERIVPHLDLPVLLRRDARNLVLVVRYLFNHPEAWILLLLLVACGARTRFGNWRRDNFWLPMILLGLAMWILYGLVNVEERYVTLAYLVVLLPVFAALRAPLPEADEFGTTPSAWLPSASTAMVVLFAFLAAGESLRLALEQRRDEAGLPHPWYNAEMFGAAHALQQLGVQPGDEVACMGFYACLNDNYWARLDGVRILTEVYNPNGNLFAQWAGLPNRAQVLDTLRNQRAKVLVAQFDPAEISLDPAAAAGWIRLDGTDLYAYPLTLRDTLDSGARTPSSTPATQPWNTTRQGGP